MAVAMTVAVAVTVGVAVVSTTAVTGVAVVVTMDVTGVSVTVSVVVVVVAVVAVVAKVPAVTHRVYCRVDRSRDPPSRTRARHLSTGRCAGAHVSSRTGCGCSGSSPPIGRHRQQHQQEARRRSCHGRKHARLVADAAGPGIWSAHRTTCTGDDSRRRGAAWPPYPSVLRRERQAGRTRETQGAGKRCEARAQKAREPLAAAPLASQPSSIETLIDTELNRTSPGQFVKPEETIEYSSSLH